MVLFGDSNSFKRRWLRQGAAWCKQFRLDKSNPGLGSWLEAAQNGTRIGCKVCSALGRKNVWGRIGVSSSFMLQCSAFERHENSDSHTQAVQTYLQRLGIAGPTKEPNDTQCPSIEEFSKHTSLHQCIFMELEYFLQILNIVGQHFELHIHGKAN